MEDSENDGGEHIKTVGIEEEVTEADRLELKKMGSLESKMFEAKKESEALIDKIYYEVVAGGFH
jgi:hypothetical protein